MAVVVQPHADDGAMSCGQLMAAYPKSTLITVFGAIPSTPDLLTPFDEVCHFSSSAEAMSVRLEEDRRAADVLDAYPVWLPNLDGQYIEGERDPVPVVESLTAALLECDPAETVFVPLGIEHPDHEDVAELAQEVCAGLLRHVVVYEELPGRVIWPPQEWQFRFGYYKRSEQVAGPMWIKEAAVACYRSQREVLSRLGMPAVFCPERFWEAG